MIRTQMISWASARNPVADESRRNVMNLMQ
jgi:hypothetical protein